MILALTILIVGLTMAAAFTGWLDVPPSIVGGITARPPSTSNDKPYRGPAAEGCRPGQQEGTYG